MVPPMLSPPVAHRRDARHDVDAADVRRIDVGRGGIHVVGAGGRQGHAVDQHIHPVVGHAVNHGQARDAPAVVRSRPGAPPSSDAVSLVRPCGNDCLGPLVMAGSDHVTVVVFLPRVSSKITVVQVGRHGNLTAQAGGEASRARRDPVASGRQGVEGVSPLFVGRSGPVTSGVRRQGDLSAGNDGAGRSFKRPAILPRAASLQTAVLERNSDNSRQTATRIVDPIPF